MAEQKDDYKKELAKIAKDLKAQEIRIDQIERRLKDKGYLI